MTQITFGTMLIVMEEDSFHQSLALVLIVTVFVLLGKFIHFPSPIYLSDVYLLFTIGGLAQSVQVFPLLLLLFVFILIML